MSDLSACDTMDLEDRIRYLMDRLDIKLKEAGPIVRNIGKLRSEIMIITDELGKRKDGKEVT